MKCPASNLDHCLHEAGPGAWRCCRFRCAHVGWKLHIGARLVDQTGHDVGGLLDVGGDATCGDRPVLVALLLGGRVLMAQVDVEVARTTAQLSPAPVRWGTLRGGCLSCGALEGERHGDGCPVLAAALERAAAPAGPPPCACPAVDLFARGHLPTCPHHRPLRSVFR